MALGGGPREGALNACRLAVQGKERGNGTFTDKDGLEPW